MIDIAILHYYNYINKLFDKDHSMEFLRNYWPLVLLTLYFIYKQYQSFKVKKMLPILRNEGAVMIDVRSEGEFQSGHAPETINMPLNTLSSSLKSLPKDKPIVVCCASGTRSAMARKVLQKNGFEKTYNVGSWTALLKG
jgi:phage shock protein E